MKGKLIWAAKWGLIATVGVAGLIWLHWPREKKPKTHA
jgi:hypothetical protein